MSVRPVVGKISSSLWEPESKEDIGPSSPATATTAKVVQSSSAFLDNLFREEAALCHPLEVDEEIAYEQLKLIGENALASQEKIEVLWGFIMHSKTQETYTEKIGRIASRAITALNLARFSFSGKDLSGVRIPHANLSRGLFYLTNFVGANLQGVQWPKAYLGNALLQRADLQGADFGQFSLRSPNITCRDACSLAVQGTLVAIGESVDAFGDKPPEIHVWSLSEGRSWHVCSWEQTVSTISLALTKDGSHLVSAGGDGYVTVWNPKNGALLHKLSPGYLLKQEFISEFSAELLEQFTRVGLILPVATHPNYVQFIFDRDKIDRLIPDQDGRRKALKFLQGKVGIHGCVVSQNLEKPIIACTNRSGHIFLYDLRSAQLESFIPTEGATGEVLYMPDGRNMLIPTKEGFKLFDSLTKQTSKTLSAQFPWNQHFCRAISADGKMIAAAGLVGVAIWSTEHEEPIKLLGNMMMQKSKQQSHLATPLAGIVQGLALSSNGQLLAINSGKEIQIWDTATWQLRDSWGGESLVYDVKGLQFTSDDEHVVAIFENGDPKVWRVSKEQSSTFEAHLDDVKSLCVTPNGKIVFSLSLNTLRMWDAKTGDCKWKEDQIEQFAVCKEGRYLLTLRNNCALLREIESKREITRFDRDTGIHGVHFLSSGRAVIIGKEMVETYEITTGKLFSILNGRVSSLKVHVFSDDGKWLAFGTEEGNLVAWDSITGNVYTIRKAHASAITSVKFSRGSIISKSDSYIHIWMPFNGSIFAFKDFDDALVVPVDGVDWILLKSAGALGVFIKKDQEGKSHILSHKLRVDCKAPLPTYLGRLDPDIISMTDDYGRIKQWSQDREMMYTSDWKYSPSISMMVLHPFLPVLAVGGDNGMVQLWNPVNGQLLDILWGHVASVTCLQFSDDGQSLFSGSKDRSLQRWDFGAGIANATLAWRSAPYSLVLHGVNTHEAILDERGETLLFDEGTKTDQGMILASLMRGEAGYVQRQYVFPTDEDSLSFSDIEVKSHNLDESIIMLHHRILKKMDDREFVEKLLYYMKDLYLLIPASFHFILDAITPVAQRLKSQTPVAPASLSELQRIFAIKVPPDPLFVRDFLDAKLRDVIERLLKMAQPAAASAQPQIDFSLLELMMNAGLFDQPDDE